MDQVLEIAKIIGTILAEIVLAFYFCKQYIKKMADKIDVSSGVKKQNAIDIDIITRMDYYKELLSADRILVFEFHNGQHYSNYRSALKMSASYEVFRAGLDSIREKCTGLPIAIMPHFISAITKDERVSCKSIEDIKESMSNSYSFKNALGMKAFYDVAIKDRNGNIIGFVAVIWNHTLDENVDAAAISKLTGFLEDRIDALTMQNKKAKKKYKKNIIKR